MTCIAAFYSHFGAVRFKRTCQELGWPAKLMPVPRDLSSSCGTCVRYQGGVPEPVPEETERIVAVEDGGYRLLYQAENS